MWVDRRGKPLAAVSGVERNRRAGRSKSCIRARVRSWKCGYFAGLSLEETAQALGVSIDTVKRDWRFAKLWLFSELRGNTAG